MRKRANLSEIDIIFENFEESKDTIRFDDCPVGLPSEMAFLHYHSKIEMGICTEGVGIFYGNNLAESVNPGDIILFLPGRAHYSQNVGEPVCRCRFAYLDAKELLFLIFQENRRVADLLCDAFSYQVPAVIRKKEFPHIYTLLHTTLEDIFSNTPDSNLLCALHLSEFLIKIPKTFTKNENSTDNTPNSSDAISVVEAFISSHYYENITSDRLCNICFLSESQLRRRFKATYGVSPMQYLKNLRCNIAGSLLIHTDLPVADIAQKVGYYDVSELYRHFSALFEMSPSSYRQKNTPKKSYK